MKTKFTIEVTDTFSGEPNYSWVRRYVFEMPEGSTRLSIIRAAKKEMGWSGIRCSKTEYAHVIELRPRAACLVVFITEQLPENSYLKSPI